MTDSELILFVFIPTLLGITAMFFNSLIMEIYEKIAEPNESAFPRLITTTRLIIGGIVLIVLGGVNIVV